MTKRIHIKDVTNKWKKYAKPCPGIIEISDYTVAKSGRVFDKINAKFGKINEEEINIGTWFKNTIWGDVKVQRGLMRPEHEPSADMLVLDGCPLLKEQTIEIKVIKKSKRIGGVDTRLRSGKEQSSNILFDITKTTLGKSVVIDRAKQYLDGSDWLKVLIIKNDRNYVVYTK